MKKSLKLLFLFVIALVVMFTSKETVFAADNSPATFKATAHELNPKPFGLTRKVYVKKTVDGKYIYCLDVVKTVPNKNITYTKSELITDPAIHYIIASGHDDVTDNDFYATQTALWIYLVDNNLMKDSSDGYVKGLKNAVYSEQYINHEISKDVREILTGAHFAKNDSTILVPILKFGITNIRFTLKNGVYVSDVIEVVSNVGNYNVTLNNEPSGTQIDWVDGGFTISIPYSKVKEGTTNIGVNINAIAYDHNVYKYVPNDSSYQNMLAVYSEKVNLSDSLTLSINKEIEEEPEDPTVIVISKRDITNSEELPGATLIIRDKDGDIVEKWISTNEPKKFASLPVGKYTLEEISSPDGYTLSTEKIEFEVKEDGKIKKVVMYNAPEEVEETIVVISKQDITTKEEVPGATLIIRDKDGKEIEKWVSGNTPHIIKGLEKGIYTLEEIIAPDGYILSNEKITFEVTENGVVTEVVMFNTPKPNDVIVVPPTGTFASKLPYIFGGLVIIIGSVLIYRNVKKEQ